MTPAQRHMQRVAAVGCVICRRLGHGLVPCSVHHIAKGTGKRSDFRVAGLCEIHHDPHRTGSGFHGMGERKFCDIFKIPTGTEYGLLELVNEDLAKYA